LLRTVTDEDVTRLTEIKIKRISKFDSFKADEKIAGIETELEEVKFHLANLTDYSVDWFKMLKKKYGEGKERRTEIRSFDTIVAAKAAVANTKLYVNLEEGFAGTGLKKSDSEFVCDCSDIDDIIVFRNNGVMQVSKISTKSFFGKGIIHIAVWKKGDMRTVYNLIYEDGKGGKAMVKRFFVNSITRDKEYQVTKGTEGSKVLYFTSNANAEAEVVQVILKPTARLKRLRFDYDFAELAIKGRASGGNTLSKFQLRRVELKEKGVSTLGARKIWFDPAVTRLNIEGRGNFLGEFQPADKILVILSTGEYHLIGFDLSTHFDDAMLHLEKWIPQKPISAVHYDGEKEAFYVKRFLAEPSSKKVLFISEGENNRLEAVSTAFHPIANLRFNKKFKKTRDKEDEQLDLHKFISVKGLKALGNRLHALPVTEVSMLDADEEREAAALAALQPGKKSDSGEDGSDDNDTEPDDSGPGGDDLPSGDDTPVTAATDNTAPSKGSEKSLTIAEKKAARKKAQAIKAPVQEAALDENTSAKLGASGEAISSSAPEDKTIATQEFADVMAEAKARREANMSAKHSDLRASKKKAPKKTVANKAVPKKIAPKKEDEPLKQNPDDIEMDIDIPEDEDSGGDGGGQGSLF
jgi:topoisomerase-4 subunit A